MLPWWQGVLLGLVQGLTEFLPVSSSGHLVLAEHLLGYQPPGVFFEVSLHVATLLSVVVAYRARIVELIKGLVTAQAGAWRYTGLLFIASVPAAVAGIALKAYFEASFHSMPALGWQFLITALVLWSTKYALARATLREVTLPQSMLIGIGQAIAIVPAISRSGMTIAAALWSGLEAEAAAEFSFMMSIIVIAGSGLLEARHIPPGEQGLSVGLLCGFIVAAASGIFAIRFLVSLLKHKKFHLFAPYCAGLGVICLVWFGLLGK